MNIRERTAHLNTKYVVDTCVFNWLADGTLNRGALPHDGDFAISHIQLDEINDTDDKERRARLLLMLASLNCKLIDTPAFVFDVSRYDFARWSDGELFTSLKSEMDGLNGNKKNNARDALIAETAIVNGFTLLTADRDLKLVTEQHGGQVLFFNPPLG
jgi:predicted nucleic acid-binding protein